MNTQNARFFFSELFDSKLVISQLVSQYVTLRYRRTALGFFWTLVNPLLTMTITSIVFSMMMRMPLQSFAVFLFTGLIPWTLFSSCILQGGGAILENEALIKKIYIPRQVFVVSRTLSLLIDALLSFLVLLIIAIAIGAHFSSALLFIPVAFLLLFLFSVGLGLVMSVVSVYYRDAPYVVGIVLQAAYYLTPIIYPLSIVPERFRWVFSLNPMFYFIELFRAPIYAGLMPSADAICLASGLAALSIFIGIFVFRRFDSSLIFRL